MGRQSLDESPIRIAILSAAIFIVALSVRLVPLGFYVTPDEPIWVMRSVEFLQAIKAGDWAGVPQTGHPGITTMALGALGVKAMAWLRRFLWAAEMKRWVWTRIELTAMIITASTLMATSISTSVMPTRSEERRVGKECR